MGYSDLTDKLEKKTGIDLIYENKFLHSTPEEKYSNIKISCQKEHFRVMTLTQYLSNKNSLNEQIKREM